jgi:hypothetical protein
VANAAPTGLSSVPPRPRGRRVVRWVVVGAIVGELASWVVLLYAFGSAFSGYPAGFSTAIGLLGAVGFGPLLGGLAEAHPRASVVLPRPWQHSGPKPWMESAG